MNRSQYDVEAILERRSAKALHEDGLCDDAPECEWCVREERARKVKEARRAEAWAQRILNRIDHPPIDIVTKACYNESEGDLTMNDANGHEIKLYDRVTISRHHKDGSSRPEHAIVVAISAKYVTVQISDGPEAGIMARVTSHNLWTREQGKGF